VPPKKRTKVPVVKKGAVYSGFDDPHRDSRCRYKKWGDRYALFADLDSVAGRAIGEHMTVQAFQEACMHAWNRAMLNIDRMNEAEAGDPPAEPAPDKVS